MPKPKLVGTYYERNREAVKARAACYRATHQAEIKQLRRDYRTKKRDQINQRCAAWHKKNHAKQLTKGKEYYHMVAVPRQMMRTYKMSEKEKNTILDRQGFLCAICKGVLEDDNGKAKTLHMDHCHFHGHFRGLICYRCNHGLGLFADPITRRDSITNLLAAVQYLLDHQPR